MESFVKEGASCHSPSAQQFRLTASLLRSHALHLSTFVLRQVHSLWVNKNVGAGLMQRTTAHYMKTKHTFFSFPLMPTIRYRSTNPSWISNWSFFSLSGKGCNCCSFLAGLCFQRWIEDGHFQTDFCSFKSRYHLLELIPIHKMVVLW